MPTNEPSMTQYRGGSPQCTDENLDYFTKKLRELHDNGTKITFREWIKRTMNLLDLID